MQRNCRKSPSYVEMLQRRIAEQQYETGVNAVPLLKDYVIAMGFSGSKCPACTHKLSKQPDRVVVHLRQKHIEYYANMLQRLFLKEIIHIKRMKKIEAKHEVERKQARYYDNLPVYFSPPEPYQIQIN
ncbi:MAG: hypothetical protein ACRD5H_11630 [Nitrososphaerales archaeon]